MPPIPELNRPSSGFGSPCKRNVKFAASATEDEELELELVELLDEEVKLSKVLLELDPLVDEDDDALDDDDDNEVEELLLDDEELDVSDASVELELLLLEDVNEAAVDELELLDDESEVLELELVSLAAVELDERVLELDDVRETAVLDEELAELDKLLLDDSSSTGGASLQAVNAPVTVKFPPVPALF